MAVDRELAPPPALVAIPLLRSSMFAASPARRPQTPGAGDEWTAVVEEIGRSVRWLAAGLQQGNRWKSPRPTALCIEFHWSPAAGGIAELASARGRKRAETNEDDWRRLARPTPDAEIRDAPGAVPQMPAEAAAASGVACLSLGQARVRVAKLAVPAITEVCFGVSIPVIAAS